MAIAFGPVRTVFELKYAPWYAGDIEVAETKKISLDLGSNLSRFEIFVESGDTVVNVTVGLTLHEKDGHIEACPDNGWFSYWQPHGDSELGMGIVVDPEFLEGYLEHIVEEPDKSHLLVHLRPIDGKVVYYAGFGWKESGQFNTEEEWIDYLADFSERLGSPLIVNVMNATEKD